MAERVLVRGRVRFEPAAPPFDDADVRIRLEDVSIADAPARVVAEQAIRGVSKPEGSGPPVPFALHGEDTLDTRLHYSVRVHVDVDRSGRVGHGDFVSTQTYPVQAGGEVAPVLEILVRRVG